MSSADPRVFHCVHVGSYINNRRALCLFFSFHGQCHQKMEHRDAQRRAWQATLATISQQSPSIIQFAFSECY